MSEKLYSKEDQKVSLDMNEKWRFFLRTELRKFAKEHPNYKFAINCWVDEASTKRERTKEKTTMQISLKSLKKNNLFYKFKKRFSYGNNR